VWSFYFQFSSNTSELALKEQLGGRAGYRINIDFLVLGDTSTQGKLAWEFRVKKGNAGYGAGIAVCNVMKDNSSVAVSCWNHLNWISSSLIIELACFH
jgi:hypothetical protein